MLRMTNAAREFIDSFEALPEQEKHEVLAQLLRRLMDTPYSSPTHEELTHAADLVFQRFADPVVVVFRAAWALFLGFRVMYGDPQLTVNSGFYLFIGTLVLVAPHILGKFLLKPA